MKVYVTSKYENYLAVREAQALLREHGFDISYDWTKAHDEFPKLTSAVQRDVYQLEQAKRDLKGALEADFQLCLGHEKIRGGMVELGVALAIGCPIFIVDARLCDNVFFHLPQVKKCPSVGHAVGEIILARLRIQGA